jgi:hypothetical protein
MMGWDGFSRFVDVLCNGRPATPAAKPKVTIEEIVRRGVSHVLLNGKLYRIEAREIEATKEEQR